VDQPHLGSQVHGGSPVVHLVHPAAYPGSRGSPERHRIASVWLLIVKEDEIKKEFVIEEAFQVGAGRLSGISLAVLGIGRACRVGQGAGTLFRKPAIPS